MGLFIAELDLLSFGINNQPWPRVYGVELITEYCLGTMTLGAECQSGVAAAAPELGRYDTYGRCLFR